MDLLAFLSCLYANSTTGVLSVWTRQDKQTAYFAEPPAFPGVVDYVSQKALGMDVYFGVGLRRRSLGSGERGGKEDVASIPALWLDVDIKGPGHKAENLPENLEQAVAVVELCPVQPTLIVDTGGGIHAYWRLDKPLVIPFGQHEKINAVCKAFQKRIIQAAKTKWGFKIDATANIDRVLRLPDTFNHKSDPKRPCKVLLDDVDVCYEFESLAFATKVLEPRLPAPGTPDDLNLDDIRKRLRNVKNEENRDIVAIVLDGKPFETGERDTKLQVAASIVAYVVPDDLVAKLDAAKLAPLFEKTIAAMAAEANDPANPPPDMANVVDKLSRALDDKARRIAEDKRIKEGFGGVSPTAAVAAAAAVEKPEPSAGPDGEKKKEVVPYTTEEIRSFAQAEKITVDELKKRWIIQHNSSYYIHSGGQYKSPVGKESFLTHVRDDLAPAYPSVELRDYTLKGGIRFKTMPEILNEYATGARHLKGSLCIERSYFDAANETFWESVCPVRQLEPEFNPQIDHWLRLLGGDEKEKLLDWIATVMRLDLQSSALYLSGEPSSGKTMLAHGLARLWHTSGPSKLEDVADTNFNADIARCPLVFGDEAIKCSTTELRRLIGSSSHILKRKYLANVDLEGSLRIILADNSGNLIHSDGMGGADMGAVASKFLSVSAGKEPVEYLRSIGGISGNPGTRNWVDGDLIARHALWLAFNREIEFGNRLIVEGSVGRMVKLLVVTDRTTGTLCEWIARYIDSPQATQASIAQVQGAQIGDGKILVSAEAIQRFWTTYVQSERSVYSMTKIGRALHNISVGKEVASFKVAGKTVRRRMHSIRPDLILAWAEEHMSCDMDEMREKINRPLGGGSTPPVSPSSPSPTTPTPPPPPTTPPASLSELFSSQETKFAAGGAA